MTIKVALGATENMQQEKPFPKLMISKSGRIVYFISTGKGLQLNYHKDSTYEENRVPNWDDCWDMRNFTDYNEPITIQNQ